MDLLREAIGPEGSNCFWKEVRTSISKETYNNVWFSRGRGPASLDSMSHLWSAHVITRVILLHLRRMADTHVWIV